MDAPIRGVKHPLDAPKRGVEGLCSVCGEWVTSENDCCPLCNGWFIDSREIEIEKEER